MCDSCFGLQIVAYLAKKGECMGKNFTSTKGSWGSWAIIERNNIPRNKVSCRTCLYYCREDRSCTVSPVLPGYMEPGYWRKCKDFVLDPDFETSSNVDRVLSAKGPDALFKHNNAVKVKEDKTEKSSLDDGENNKMKKNVAYNSIPKKMN